MKLFALCANSVKNHLMARDIVPAGQQCLPVQLRIVGLSLIHISEPTRP